MVRLTGSVFRTFSGCYLYCLLEWAIAVGVQDKMQEDLYRGHKSCCCGRSKVVVKPVKSEKCWNTQTHTHTHTHTETTAHRTTVFVRPLFQLKFELLCTVGYWGTGEALIGGTQTCWPTTECPGMLGNYCLASGIWLKYLCHRICGLFRKSRVIDGCRCSFLSPQIVQP